MTSSLEWVPVNGKRRHRILNSIKECGWRFIISPLFLLMAIIMIFMIPHKHLQAKRWMNRRAVLLQIAKRFLDIIGACMGLVLSSVLFLILPVLIKLESNGDVIFKQTRIGINRRKRERRAINVHVPFDRRRGERRKRDLCGKPFQLYKFRSMRADAERKIGAVWASRNDPRVTHIGKIIRPLHIDEIPQYVNVLKGEMSLVGPRPERPEFVKELREKIPNYVDRLKNKPGITGLAQISCGYDSSLEDVITKVKYDLRYINDLNNGDFWADIKILFLTLKKILFKKTIEDTSNRKKQS